MVEQEGDEDGVLDGVRLDEGVTDIDGVVLGLTGEGTGDELVKGVTEGEGREPD